MNLKRPEEQQAADLLGKSLGGTTCPRDTPGAPPLTHDFDVKTAHGTVAVEVTTFTDEQQRRLWGAVDAKRWHFPNLSGCWVITLSPHADINQLHQQLEQLLLRLERAGIHDFGWSSQVPPGLAATVRQLLDLGVISGRRLANGNAGVAISGAHAICVDTAEVTRQLSTIAFKTDNLNKLGKAQAHERHVFVWLDEFAFAAIAAARYGLLGPLQLPDGIDAVWIADRYTREVRRFHGKDEVGGL